MPTPEKILSVLLPSYRAMHCIARAIESIACSSSVEVVVAPDDGSDGYACLEDTYPGLVKVLPPSLQTGPGAARNRAFAATSGQFITMLDADDSYAPGAVDEALELARRSSSQISFFRTAYIDERNSSVVRELAVQPSFGFQDFQAFQGSVHALYARRHWIAYRHLISEDVLQDAQILLAAGGHAPMTRAPYLQHLNPQSLCANTQQDVFNRVYRQIRDEATEPKIKSLYQAKLDMGQAYASSLRTGGAMSFHSFVMRQSVGRSTSAPINN
jgi:glycosyltransferase involved in cell wall biosynthesis